MLKKLIENIKFELELLDIDWMRIIISIFTSLILIGLGMFIMFIVLLVN
jgi:hypothetical protein